MNGLMTALYNEIYIVEECLKASGELKTLGDGVPMHLRDLVW